MAIEKKNGGSLLMDCLIELGGHQGFGVPGESYLAVLDALFDRNKKFQLTVCRNEGGASFMAEAWGKLTGRGTLFLLPRPGSDKCLDRCHTAMQNSTPMILFVGQVGTAMRVERHFKNRLQSSVWKVSKMDFRN